MANINRPSGNSGQHLPGHADALLSYTNRLLDLLTEHERPQGQPQRQRGDRGSRLADSDRH